MIGRKAMFLHIGGAQIVFTRELIGIFKVNTAVEDVNAEFMAAAGFQPKEIKGSGRPKSFVLTDRNIYLSPISPLTLSRRKNMSC
jgi:extracellular matrix regulatory protein B